MGTRLATLVSHRLVMWFMATTIVPAVGLGWLGWQMVAQDRRLAGQRLQETRDQAAELAATALQRTLAELEGRLAMVSAASPLAADVAGDDVAFVALDARGMQERTGLRLPYGPERSPAQSLAGDLFAPAEALEFQRHDSAGAARLLRPLAASANPAERAAALLRLGRNLRKLGDRTQAADTFAELVSLDHTPAGALPAGLQGHQGRAKIFADADRREELQHEASLLDEALRSGRWRLTRSQYEFSVGQVRDWLGNRGSAAHDSERLALADAVEILWNEWRGGDSAADRSANPQGALTRGRRILRVADRSILALTRGSDEQIIILLAGPAFLDRAWRVALPQAIGDRGIEFALTDAEGRAVLGRADAPVSSQSVRTPSVTQLPWTVHAISTPAAEGAALSGPGRLMLVAVLVMTFVVLAGGYFINRAIARELAVARLQSDFVAAVSHEFRTPLTTIRQLSEMLVRARVSTTEKRQQFYETLLRESERLQRLVESLLNFAHLESGKLEYQFEAVDPNDFVQTIVAEFQEEVSASGYQVEFSGLAPVPSIRADRELLARVFWNLLDNAVKYSPEARNVRVEMAQREGRLLIRVTDQGLGIPASEQRGIFLKFVRGAAAKAASIKGTGIGLAMAREIVHAHGGDIEVLSEPGVGSTFTVSLPIALDQQTQPLVAPVVGPCQES